MSEIVFTQTFENRQNIAGMQYGRTPTDDKVTIWKNHDKVSVVHSTLVCGVPRGHVDKRYYYWRTIHSAGFRRTKTGTVVPFSCHRPWDAKVGTQWRHKFPDEPFNWLSGTGPQDEAGGAYQHAVWQEFDFRSVFELFPMMESYRINRYGHIPSSLRSGFRQRDMRRLAEIAFGKTRVTGRLVDAVDGSDPYLIAYAQQFRGLVDNDSIVDFLENNHFDEEMEEGFKPHSPNIRPLLLALDRATCEKILAYGMDLADSKKVADMARYGKGPMKAIGDRQMRNKRPVTSIGSLTLW